MSTYPSLDDYNADVTAAREAYRADESVRNGYCAICHERPRETKIRSRRCRRCRAKGLKEGGQS